MYLFKYKLIVCTNIHKQTMESPFWQKLYGENNSIQTDFLKKKVHAHDHVFAIDFKNKVYFLNKKCVHQ